jgi:hypothetical protein
MPEEEIVTDVKLEGATVTKLLYAVERSPSKFNFIFPPIFAQPSGLNIGVLPACVGQVNLFGFHGVEPAFFIGNAQQGCFNAAMHPRTCARACLTSRSKKKKLMN